MPASITPSPIPTQAVDAPDVATATNLQLRRMGQATKAGAGFAGSVRTLTGATYISSNDFIVRGDTTSAGFTLTLPSISEYSRMIVLVIRSAGANTLTLASRGSDTINGAASIAVTNMVLVYATSNSTWVATTIG